MAVEIWVTSSEWLCRPLGSSEHKHVPLELPLGGGQVCGVDCCTRTLRNHTGLLLLEEADRAGTCQWRDNLDMRQLGELCYSSQLWKTYEWRQTVYEQHDRPNSNRLHCTNRSRPHFNLLLRRIQKRIQPSRRLHGLA